MKRDPLRPEKEVDAAVGEPHRVLGRAQQHRVADHPTGVVGHQHVAAAPGGQPGQVAGDQIVGEGDRVRPLDLHLPLGAHVPQGDRLAQRLVVVERRPAVVERHVHVVVDHVLHRARGLGGGVVGGAPGVG